MSRFFSLLISLVFLTPALNFAASNEAPTTKENFFCDAQNSKAVIPQLMLELDGTTATLAAPTPYTKQFPTYSLVWTRWVERASSNGSTLQDALFTEASLEIPHTLNWPYAQLRFLVSSEVLDKQSGNLVIELVSLGIDKENQTYTYTCAPL